MPSISNELLITYFQNHGDRHWPAPAKIQQIFQLDQEDFPFPWSQSTWEKLESQSAHVSLALLHQGQSLNGFSLFRPDHPGSTAHLDKIVISRDLRKKGIGRWLLKDSMEQLELQGIRNFTLEVEEDNQSAFDLYKGLGFIELHRVEKYYSNGQNALVMQRTLSCLNTQ